ncbi:MAG TPA: hypothetical protein VM243_04740 [Phycisphaerae bacterium]|nr:hypothetical protein [Phycisphaerae bacterium]
MRQPGSILIVVLGLLAILAVVGITFVTMSSIDRSTAANFALQTQFDLAADGAVEFACHALVQDLWELSPSNRDYTTMLMSGLNNNEVWDAPGVNNATGANDLWLADTVEPAAAGLTPKNLSFGRRVTSAFYSIPFGGLFTSMPIDAPDNLGTGLTNARNGIWLPELAFPYEGGLIRTSITIQDHASLINLNAHGNRGADANYWRYADMVGRGYFISDVAPPFNPDYMGYLLNGCNLPSGAKQPGRWSKPEGQQAPGNPNVGEIIFENPAAALLKDGVTPRTAGLEGDYPFTLDEEFDLRRITDSVLKFPTRISGGSNPIIPGLADSKLRLAYTTVGWTSEARGDGLSAGHLTAMQGNSTEGVWSARKADLNFDNPKAIYSALYFGRTCPINGETAWGGQFAANVAGFRDGTTGCGIKGYDLGTEPKAAAASRQPILSKVVVDSGPTPSESPPTANSTYSWVLKVQVIAPWLNDTAMQDDTAGLTTDGMAVEFNPVADSGATADPVNLPANSKSFAPTPYHVHVCTINITKSKTNVLTGCLQSISLTYTPPGSGKITIDQIDNTADAAAFILITSGIYRPIFTELESRGASDPSPVTVLYVGPWQAGLNGSIDSFTQEANKSKTSGIPIRFPRSVDGTSSNLPPRAPAALKPFKAIARLGDIDQILCPNTDPTVAGNKGSGDFWPWVPRVAKATANNLTSEANEKFNWDDTVQPGGSNVSRLNAANVLAVGGPWKDNLDNDGDGKMDTNDKGTGDSAADLGRFAGPELRVAGKVNLNTATSATLQAMESGLRISGLSVLATPLPNKSRTVFKSTAETLNLSLLNLACTVPNPNARGPLEQRDEAFNRISNIASVRSDTYSIYGTVQYGTIDTAAKKFNVLRSRRFWALVDRSPSLAYPPTDSHFIHPRILNFQWMN